MFGVVLRSFLRFLRYDGSLLGRKRRGGGGCFLQCLGFENEGATIIAVGLGASFLGLFARH